MSRALVLLIEAQAFSPNGTDAPVIRLVSGGSRADHFGEQWLPALTQLPQMGARLGFNGVSFQAPVTSTTGNFAFSLNMGDLERTADLVWDGADIKIYQGFDGDEDGDFNLLWHGRARSAQATSEAITVTLADPAKELDTPVLATRFEGTGGIEGGEDLKGRLKPKAWGFCENIPAILVDPANLVYRLIDGPSTISLVKDGGVPFNFGTDYPDYASLAAASIPQGQVGICSSLSLVKPWRAPRFALTADITAFGPMRVGDIAENLIAATVGVEFAPGAIDGFNALQPSHASSYVNDERTVAQELDRLFGGVGSWWMPDAQGSIRLGQMGFGPVVLNVTGSVESITRNRALPPTHRRVLGHRPNYTPLSEGDIGGAVQAGDIEDLGALATQSTINWDNQVVGRPLNFRVVARGLSATSHPRLAGLWDDSDTQLATAARSYTVNVMDRATRNWISHTHYDVHGSSANAQAMANALNALGSDKIVAIFTHDNPERNRLSGTLPAAMRRCGASKPIFESSNFKERSAYILIGIPGIGEGNGVELYAGDQDNDPDAWIDTSFTVDTLGNLQLTSTNVRDALDISYSDGTILDDVQPEEAGANVTGTNVAAGFDGQGALATLSNIPQSIADESNLLQFTGGGVFEGDLNAEANLAASNALNKGWATDDLKHWYGDFGRTIALASAYTIVDTPDGIVSGQAIRAVNATTSSKDIFSELIPIDPARNYQVTLWARQPSGDKKNYLLTSFYKADKSLIEGNGGNSNATGWSKGTFHYTRIVNQPFPTTWTKYQFTFGPQGELSIPTTPGHEAVFAQIGILGLRNGATETTIELQGFRIDEIADATQLINGPAEAGAQPNRPGQNLLNSDAGPEHTATHPASTGGWTHVYLDRVKLSDLSLLPGETTLSFSCDLRTDGVDGAAPRIRFYDAAGAQLVEYTTPFTFSTGYIREEIENFTIPANATEIHLAVDDNYSTGGQTWCRRAMLNIGPKALAFEEPPVRISRGDVELGAQINAPNTLAMIVNEKISGVSNTGEGYFCGVSQGQGDISKDGFIIWNGARITIPRDTGGDQEGFITNASYRRGFIAYDTALTTPFTVHAKARNMAFVFKIGNQWYYDTNSTNIAFTPTSAMIAIAWLQTGAADTIIGSGLLSPVNLETAALPGADVTEDSPWARVGAQPSIVPNGDFEQDLAGWQIVEQTDLDPANTKIIDDAVEGKVLSFPNSGGDRAIGSLTFRVFPGQTYRAVIRARHLGTNTLEDGAYFRLQMRGQHAPVITGTNRNQFHDFFNGNGGTIKNTWDTYEFDYTIPTGMNYANLAFYNWSQSAVDFQIERMELMPLGGAAEWGANITGNNIASGISGQGALATLSQAIWNAHISGIPYTQLLNNMLDVSQWKVGTSGSQGNFTQNGGTSENSIILGDGPQGTTEVLWRARSVTSNDADGGWNNTISNGFDHKKTYRSTVWIKQTSTNGTKYHGCSSGSSSSTYNLGGGRNTNPYFWSGDLPQNNKWYLAVGIVHGSGYTGGNTLQAGIYDPETGERVIGGTEYRNAPGATNQRQRVYQYYTSSDNIDAFFARPRFEEVNGQEPSIGTLLADRRALLGFQRNGRIWDSRNTTQSLVGGASNAITTPHLSAADVGSTATITISSHTRKYDFGNLTYSAGSIGGRSFNTRYYIYADDGAYTGGNVTYQATTTHSNVVGVNRIYLGSITTPSNGGTGGGGGGGIGDPFDDCLAAHMLLSNGKYARDLKVGDMIDVMDDDMKHVGDRPVLALRHATQNCVELVTKSARVVVSTTAPVVTREQGTLTAPQVKGLTVAVRIKGVFAYEQVLDVIPVGEKPIVRLNVGGISFSAGQESDRLIYTHNIVFKR